MSLSLIAAVGKNRELGKNNGLCFRIPNDLKFFKEVTVGHPIVMGAKTWESLPKKLPGREHFVAVTKKRDWPEDIHQIMDLKGFSEEWQQKEEEVFVIGGASIYQTLLPYCDKLYITEVHAEDPEADVFFPEFDTSEWNREVLGGNEDFGISYDHVLYTRK